MSAKAERLHLRVDEQQKALLEAASQAAGDSVSAFVLKAATEAAALALRERVQNHAARIERHRCILMSPRGMRRASAAPA